MPDLSIIIPSYKDPCLHRTINSLIKNARGEIEIIPVLDGYWPPTPVKIDERIRVVHLGKNRGMREAINAGVAVSRGKYIMRTDEHCLFGKDFDRILTKNIKDNWIVTPRRFYLDPVKWQILDIPPVDYEKLKIRKMDCKEYKFEGVKWHSRAKERKHKMIDQTMSMQGSVWVMKRSWWDKVIKKLETKGYGPMYQDSHEMVFKTWQAGGKLVVNKRAWFAHKHVSFPRTHNYKKSDYEPCLKYALDKWRDYYLKVIKPKWKI